MSAQVCLGQNGEAVGEGPGISTPRILADEHYGLFDMDVNHLLRVLPSLPILKLMYETVLARSQSVGSGRGYLEKKWESHTEYKWCLGQSCSHIRGLRLAGLCDSCPPMTG